MTNPSKRIAVPWKRLTVVVAAICAFGFALPMQVAQAQDDVEAAQQAFSKRQYPWYDAETNRIQKIEFPDRLDAKSLDRNQVRLGKDWSRNTAAGTTRKPTDLSIVAWCLVALLIAGLSGLLIWAFFKLESQRRTSNDSLAPRSFAESIQHLPFQVDQATGDFRELAEQAYAAGDYRRAITYLFSHTLVTLDQNGLIRLRKGKTNRQYLGELHANRGMARFFQTVMVPFEATFFGDHQLSQQEFEACWEQLDEFLDGVDQRPRVAP